MRQAPHEKREARARGSVSRCLPHTRPVLARSMRRSPNWPLLSTPGTRPGSAPSPSPKWASPGAIATVLHDGVGVRTGRRICPNRSSRSDSADQCLHASNFLFANSMLGERMGRLRWGSPGAASIPQTFGNGLALEQAMAHVARGSAPGARRTLQRRTHGRFHSGNRNCQLCGHGLRVAR